MSDVSFQRALAVSSSSSSTTDQQRRAGTKGGAITTMSQGERQSRSTSDNSELLSRLKGLGRTQNAFLGANCVDERDAVGDSALALDLSLNRTISELCDV